MLLLLLFSGGGYLARGVHDASMEADSGGGVADLGDVLTLDTEDGDDGLAKFIKYIRDLSGGCGFAFHFAVFPIIVVPNATGYSIPIVIYQNSRYERSWGWRGIDPSWVTTVPCAMLWNDK